MKYLKTYENVDFEEFDFEERDPNDQSVAWYINYLIDEEEDIILLARAEKSDEMINVTSYRSLDSGTPYEIFDYFRGDFLNDDGTFKNNMIIWDNQYAELFVLIKQGDIPTQEEIDNKRNDLLDGLRTNFNVYDRNDVINNDLLNLNENFDFEEDFEESEPINYDMERFIILYGTGNGLCYLEKRNYNEPKPDYFIWNVDNRTDRMVCYDKFNNFKRTKGWRYAAEREVIKYLDKRKIERLTGLDVYRRYIPETFPIINENFDFEEDFEEEDPSGEKTAWYLNYFIDYDDHSIFLANMEPSNKPDYLNCHFYTNLNCKYAETTEYLSNDLFLDTNGHFKESYYNRGIEFSTDMYYFIKNGKEIPTKDEINDIRHEFKSFVERYSNIDFDEEGNGFYLSNNIIKL